MNVMVISNIPKLLKPEIYCIKEAIKLKGILGHERGRTEKERGALFQR